MCCLLRGFATIEKEQTDFIGLLSREAVAAYLSLSAWVEACTTLRNRCMADFFNLAYVRFTRCVGLVSTLILKLCTFVSKLETLKLAPLLMGWVSHDT